MANVGRPMSCMPAPAPAIWRRWRHALLLRRAEVRSGLPRWEILAEAAALLPVDAPHSRSCVADLLAECNEPMPDHVIAALAKDADLRAQLMLHQAKLSPDAIKAGEILWQLSESGKLPDAQFAWACELWNDAKQGDRVIRAAQRWLRAEKDLGQSELLELAAAYRAAGRDGDARRAETEAEFLKDLRPQTPVPLQTPARLPGGRGGGMF